MIVAVVSPAHCTITKNCRFFSNRHCRQLIVAIVAFITKIFAAGASAKATAVSTTVIIAK